MTHGLAAVGAAQDRAAGGANGTGGTPAARVGAAGIARAAGESAGTLLIVAHGSRDPRHAATVGSLAARVRALRPEQPVEVGYLDHCAPRIGRLLSRLEGTGPVVALPLLLNRAFHARSDIPAVLAEAARAQPGLTIRQGAVLGPSALLLDALDRRLAEAGVHPSRRTGVVLAAAGSSDPAATEATRRVAATWQRLQGWGGVEVAHASAAPPRVADAVATLRARGLRHIVVAPYLLAPGLLPDRITAQAAAAGVDTVAAPLGAAPELARLLLLRHGEALTESAADSARSIRIRDRVALGA